ncbi:MAG: LptF/LptG family permease [Candidatus Aminicenantes bacterium]|nr:LptF/LptG family permease [Candidatus Aminicenantes bacterium]NLH77046.1 YjgP/YjgQ family permease [Acidobacteriota bacterium]
MVRLIDRYVLREVVPPFLVGLLLVSFVLLMNEALLLADLFIAKGVPLLAALRLFGLLIPSILVFALPMAVLLGVLGGLARFSADSEIVAFRSLGVGPGGLARPIAVFGLAGMISTLPLALILAPRANGAWVRAMTGSVVARVQLDVEPREFNETFPGLVFLVRDVDPDGTWRDVFASMGRDPENPRFLMARSGRIRLFPEERRAILELTGGTSYSGPLASPGDDTVTAFDRLEEEIDVAGMFPSLATAKRVREKDIGELTRDLEALKATPPAAGDAVRQVRAHRIEIHKKFALAAACLVFALLGLPLGVMAGRAGRMGGFSLGLALVLVYYVLITAGERAAMDGRLSAPAGMWGPNLLLTVAAVWLLLRRRISGPRGRPPRPAAARETAEAPSRPAAVDGGRARSRFPAFRFPGLLDRYISRKFLVLLAFVLAALSAAAFLFTFLETWDEVRYAGKPVGLAARYALAKLPELLPFLLPVAVLAAALLALGLLARTNEATALKACGVSVYRTVLPVLALAAAASAIAFLVQERVVPASRLRAEAAWNDLYDMPPRRSSYLNRNWVLGRYGARIYHFDYFEPRASTFGRLSVLETGFLPEPGEGREPPGPGREVLVSRTFAESASFDGNALVYRNGWTRRYGAGPGPALSRSEAGRLDVTGDIAVFRTPWREPLRMTYGELGRYVADVRAMGFPAVRLRAALAGKIALPFVSLIMSLLAVPFGFRMGRKGTLVGLGLSLALAMAYWGTFALCRSLGAAGVLSPFLGAWGANLLFGLGGIVGISRMRT